MRILTRNLRPFFVNSTALVLLRNTFILHLGSCLTFTPHVALHLVLNGVALLQENYPVLIYEKIILAIIISTTLG